MEKINLFLLAVILFSVGADAAKCEQGWVMYKDELCVQILHSFFNYDDAKIICADQAEAEGSKPSLVMIKDAEMQQFIETYSQGNVDNLWLGGKYEKEASQFRWVDGEPISHYYWQQGYPKNVTESDTCLEFAPANLKRSTIGGGSWANVLCRKRNQVMCQTSVSWSNDELVAEVMKIRKELAAARDEQTATKLKLSTTQSDLTATRARLSATETNLTTTRADLSATLSDLSATKSDLAATKSDLSVTRSDLSATRASLSATHANLTTTRAELSSTRTDLSATRASLSATRSDLSAQQSDLSAIEANLTSTRSDLSATRTSLESTQADLTTTQSDLSTARASVTSIRADLTVTRSDLSTTKASLTSTQADLATTRSDLSATRTSLSTIQRDLTATRSDLSTTKASVTSIRADLTATRSDLSTTKASLTSTRADLTATRSDLSAARTSLSSTQRDLTSVTSRVVPVGSIYIEYRNQPAPRSLWPTYTWQDISSSYAGLFFRAYGSGSAGWGSTQAECAPRITNVEHGASMTSTYPNSLSIPSNGWSQYFWLGDNDIGNMGRWHESLRMYTQGCEVRPKNQAIRIWKRTA